MIDISRPVGSNKEWQQNKKILKAKADTDKWASDLAPEARKIIKELMFSTKSSPVVRKGCAEIVLKRVDDRFKELGGKAEYLTDEEVEKKQQQEQSEKAKKKTEENGGTPFLRLTCETPDEKTGTND